MIQFRRIALSDKVWIDELLSYSDFRGAEYCFTNLFIWESVFNSQIARFEDFILFTSGEGESRRYLLPAGRGDYSKVLEILKQDAINNSAPFVIIGIPQNMISIVKEVFPMAEITPIRNSFDYIYESEKLVSLAGKKLQPKRNLLARFKDLQDCSFEEIDSININECKVFTQKWCKEVGGCKDNHSLHSELCAVGVALKNFSDLKLWGGLIRYKGEVVAYSMGEALNSDTVIVHIEKATSSLKGVYQAINNEFVKRFALEHKYVNREDDAGDEGLRRAKESYYPVFMQEKYSAKII